MFSDKATVLFVDDEERMLRALVRIFKNHYRVLTASNGEEALEILKQSRVHVLVSDQRMSTLTGVEVLREAKEISPYTMRLLLTGYSDMEAIIGSINEGEIFRFISKPWEPNEIHSIVDRAADISQSLFESLDEISGQIEIAKTYNQEELSAGILVIDDDQDIFDEVCGAVGSENSFNYQVYWGKTLEDSFEILATEKIGVVVSEIILNEMNISEALQSLKRHHPDVLTIALTSHRDNTVLIDLINHGQIYRFLPKPASKRLLSKSITAALKHHAELVATPQLTQAYEVDTMPAVEQRPFSDKLLRFIHNMAG